MNISTKVCIFAKVFLLPMLFCTMYQAQKSIIAVFFVCLACILGACEHKKTQKNTKLRILCTTGMIADGIKNIVQDSAEVVALMGEGVDPHLYKATTGDLEKLYEADLIFYNGLHLEGKMGQILHKLSSLKPTIALGEGLDKEALLWVDSANHVADPHIWFDVVLWAKSLHYAAKQLPKYDPKNRLYYEQNAANYCQRLSNLDSMVGQKIRQIPDNQRILITSHDAFNYFGRRYGIAVRGLQGVSTTAEFGLRDVSELVTLICNNKIKAIFTETSVSEKSIEAVVQGCKARQHEVKIGGHLFTDAMGAAGTPQGTYIGMIETNLALISKGLQAN
jgi:manganese/zinc/iron transport system substrate-binding protein